MTPIKITAKSVLGILFLIVMFALPQLAIAEPRLPGPRVNKEIPRGQIIRPELFTRTPAELRLALRRPASITPATPFAPDTRFTAHVTVRNTGGSRAYIRVVQVGSLARGRVGVTASSRTFWVNPGQTVQAQVSMQAIRGKIVGDRYRTTLHLFNARVPASRGLLRQGWVDRYAANNSLRINVPIRAMQYTVFVKLNNITFNGNCRPVGHRVSHRMQITAEARYSDTRPSGPLFARSAQSANFPSSGEYTARLRPGANIRINKTFRFDHIYKGHPFRMSVAMTRYDKRDWLPIVRGSLGTAVTEVRPLVWLYGSSMTNHSAGGVTRSRFVCRNNGAFSAHWVIWSRPER
ncbi:MAG TPA: hypothetical protein ENG78_06545 [Acidiferrobacteraceae bacterium]|nr:hypothetical protein [Acidiferrobacteraceae bacterium]HEX20460.1 hypothetical protein [Acidiferrobacteraceae bacterium]